ncbi:PREDICTED: Fc receptor-like protein 6 [Nanorana parkeri]|uniref:Fc receptor-like protein 6 n=1 Tax=Nanorana parkeri TaxID=125878 RepID=UPI0008545BEE|nr:PREDICTED: Fc receptor-like protein 6 [Nanorana parkeri]
MEELPQWKFFYGRTSKAPYASKNLQHVFTTLGMSMNLAKSEKPWTYHWYKDNQPIPGNQQNLPITYSRDENSGDYRCGISVSDISDPVTLNVTSKLFSPPGIKVTTNRVIEGGDMTVTCDTRLDSLRGGTKLLFAFYRDERTVQEFSVSDTYRVRSAQLEDSGKYTCEVRTATDTVRKRSDEFYIRIYEGAIRPVVTFTPNWGKILQNDSVTLICNVTSTVPEEPRTYHWYKDNQPIPGKQQTLPIRSSGVGDSGDYQCRVSGSDISDPVTLSVINNYLILQRPPSAFYEGDPLTLRCHHMKVFTGLPATFYKDDEEIKPQSLDEFHIHKVDLNTTGHYKCTKEINRVDYPEKYSAELPVTVKELFSPPEIKVQYRVIEGGDMTVRCDTRLDPLRGGTELQFAFYRDGRTVQEFSVSDTYRVRSAQLENSGKYTCEVRTATDTVRKRSDEFYIRIYELFSPPDIKVTPYWVIKGGDMTVRCDTKLDPLRGVTELLFAFYRDGRTVQGFSVSNTYRVQSAQLEDSGKYTCEVRTVTDTVRKMSDEFYIPIYDYTAHNIIRLVISVCVLVAAVCFIYFHNKW